MGLSRLNEPEFKHNFCDFLNPLYAFNLKPETTFHYLLRFHLFQIQRRTLFNNIKEIHEHITTDHQNDLDQVFLYWNEHDRYDTNRIIPLSTFTFDIESSHFSSTLVQPVLYEQLLYKKICQ